MELLECVIIVDYALDHRVVSLRAALGIQDAERKKAPEASD